MDRETQINAIDRYIQSVFTHDSTGHDVYHMRRVANLAKSIAIDEQANIFLVEAGALLHDIGDKKLFPDPSQSIRDMKEFLFSIDLSDDDVHVLEDMIADISFSKGAVPIGLEGKIIQDADRLDAIGAVGIARTFAFGGAHGQSIYSPKDKRTSIHHFYDKLLKLKDTLHTRKAKELAEKRHQFLHTFLEQFFNEWKFKNE